MIVRSTETALLLRMRTLSARSQVARALTAMHLTTKSFATNLAARRTARRLGFRTLETKLLFSTMASAHRSQQRARRTRTRMTNQIAGMRAVRSFSKTFANFTTAVHDQIWICIRTHRFATIANVLRLLNHDKLAMRTSPVQSATLAGPRLHASQVQHHKAVAARPHLRLFANARHANHALVAATFQLSRQIFAQLRQSSVGAVVATGTSTRTTLFLL